MDSQRTMNQSTDKLNIQNKFYGHMKRPIVLN